MAASNLYTYAFTVPEEAIDFNGHVDNVTYLKWFVEAALRHADTLGWGMDTCRKMGRGWVAKRHTIEYLRPAFAKERVTMKTWLESIGRIKTIRRYELWRDDTLLARCETEWIFVDAATGRPVRLPETLNDA